MIDPQVLAAHLGLQRTQRLKPAARRCGIHLSRVGGNRWKLLTEKEAERIIVQVRCLQAKHKKRKRSLTGRIAKADPAEPKAGG